MCVQWLFCREFNSKQFLLEVFFHIIGIMTPVYRHPQSCASKKVLQLIFWTLTSKFDNFPSKLPQILITEYLKFPKRFLKQFWNVFKIFVKNLFLWSANLLFWLAYFQIILVKNFRSLSFITDTPRLLGEGGTEKGVCCVLVLKGLYQNCPNFLAGPGQCKLELTSIRMSNFLIPLLHWLLSCLDLQLQLDK